MPIKHEDSEAYSTMEEYLKGYREFFKEMVMDNDQSHQAPGKKIFYLVAAVLGKSS